MSTLFITMTDDDFRLLLKTTIQNELKEINKSMPQFEDKPMTIEEAQAFLGGVSKVTIHSWLKKKLIRSYRIGRRIFFKKQELIECMGERKKP